MRKFAILSLWIAGCTTAKTEPPPFPEQELAITRQTESTLGEDKDPEITPDGRSLVFVTSRYSPRYNIYMKPINGNVLTRLAPIEEADQRFPAINPNTKEYPNTIAFASNKDGEWAIYLIQDFVANPRSWKRVSEEGMQSIHPSFSPDGTKLVWCSTEQFGKGTWVLKVRDLLSGQLSVLDGIDGLLPHWNPKDNRIVFQRMEHRDRWFGSIWTLELHENWVDTGAGQSRLELRVTNVKAVYSGDDWAAINPCWNNDGTKIVFATVAKSRARAGILNEADDLWIMDADGTQVTRLTTHPAADWMPTCAPDGEIFFVSKRDGRNHIWSLRPKSLSR